MRQSHKIAQSTESPESIAESVIEMLPRLHVVVIGPGLGRDKLMQDTCAKVIEAAKKQNMPFVLDADGLYLAQTRPELVKGYQECILTPNVVEFGRLAKAVGVEIPKPGEAGEDEVCAKVSRAYGGVLIIQKGYHDYISRGDQTMICDLTGGRKRSGGQGDTLTGSLGTLLAYRKAYLDGIWKTEGNHSKEDLMMLAAFGGSAITRECSRLAFLKNGRSLQASDLTEMVSVAFDHLVGEKDETGQDESKL